MSLKVYKPSAMVELKVGEEGNPPKQWNYAQVMLRSLGKDEMEPHPAFLDGQRRPMQMREFDIELISNIVDYNCGSHLEAREFGKKTIFCSRNHRGKDQLGIAHRKGDEGEYFLTICDPLKCDIRINQQNNNSRTRKIHSTWQKLYPDSSLSGQNSKHQLEAVKCKHSLFFIFRLLTPDGEYAHATGEFCLFSSHAETNHRIYRKLCDLFDATAGNLAGLRLKLVYDPISTVHGGSKKAAWNIFQPEGSDLAVLRQSALERRVVQQTALARVSDETALARMVEDSPDIVSMALSEQRRMEQVRAEQGDPQEAGLLYFNPMVREICERLDFSNMWVSTLPMIARGNMSRFVHWARQQAEQYTFTPYGEDKPIRDPRSIEDILQKYGWGKWEATEEPVHDSPAALPEATSPPIEVAATEVYQADDADDAEYEVVPDTPFDAQAAMDAAKGIVQDEQIDMTAYGPGSTEAFTPTAAEPPPPPPAEPLQPKDIIAKAKAKREELKQYPELAQAQAEQTSIFGGEDT